MLRSSLILAFFLVAPLAYGQDMRPHPGNQAEVSNASAAGPAVCGTGGSCCFQGGAGCEDVLCCTAACAADSWCCEVEWDFNCVAYAETMCGDLCDVPKTCPSVGDCCTEHPGPGCSDSLCCNRVCTAIESCCDIGWGPECVAEAARACSQCDIKPACPRDGDCCFNNAPERGCERVACCELVCDLDGYCCEVEWDDQCGTKARQNCPNVCVCALFGDFDESGTINLFDFAALQICFSGAYPNYVGPGCECSDYDGDDDSDIFDFAHFGQ